MKVKKKGGKLGNKKQMREGEKKKKGKSGRERQTKSKDEGK